MAEALAVFGGIAAAAQLLETTAKTTVLAVRFVRGFPEISKKLATLLEVLDQSLTRVCYICNELLLPSSRMFGQFEPFQLNRLTRTVGLQKATVNEVHSMLKPLVDDNRNLGRRSQWLRRMLKGVTALKIEHEIAEKLQSLDRLNVEFIQELGLVSLELQVTTKALLVGDTPSMFDISTSEIGVKLDLLSGHLERLASTVRQPPSGVSDVDNGSITIQEENATVIEGTESNMKLSTTYTVPKSKNSAHNRTSSDGDLLQQHHHHENLLRYLYSGSTKDTSGPDSILQSTLADANLDFLLFNINTFYTQGNFDASSNLTLKIRFWKDISSGIYFYKVSDEKRGLALTQKSTQSAQTVLRENTAAFIIELLSTLSPVNTSTCPHVRQATLRSLSKSAAEHLPPGHPIRLMLRNLSESGFDSNESSLRALRFVADRLRSQLGPAHRLTMHAYHRLIPQLRRSGDHVEALRVSKEAVGTIAEAIGQGTLKHRQMMRHLEHIYIEQGEWARALGLCFQIVGQRLEVPPSPHPGPRYHDEYSVWTMEDIAKIYEGVGNLDQAIAWLKQARLSGGMVWGLDSIDVMHIHDKLDALLVRCGRTNEAHIWRASFGETEKLDVC